jgi:GH24 family phage-related lysozyme (muramidase)
MSEAWREIQRLVGVEPDGKPGPRTAEAVLRALRAAQPPASAPAQSPRIGLRARALLHHFESCRLEAYRCPAGVWTIGWGNTFYADGRPVRQGDRITQAEADALFSLIVRQFEDGVARAAKAGTSAQFGAMVALAYNIGLAAFRRSSVLTRHNAGDFSGAADAFRMWNRAGGKVLAGLTRRREAEMLLYLGQLAAFDKAIGFKP